MSMASLVRRFTIATSPLSSSALPPIEQVYEICSVQVPYLLLGFLSFLPGLEQQPKLIQHLKPDRLLGRFGARFGGFLENVGSSSGTPTSLACKKACLATSKVVASSIFRTAFFMNVFMMRICRIDGSSPSKKDRKLLVHSSRGHRPSRLGNRTSPTWRLSERSSLPN